MPKGADQKPAKPASPNFVDLAQVDNTQGEIDLQQLALDAETASLECNRLSTSSMRQTGRTRRKASHLLMAEKRKQAQELKEAEYKRYTDFLECSVNNKIKLYTASRHQNVTDKIMERLLGPMALDAQEEKAGESTTVPPTQRKVREKSYQMQRNRGARRPATRLASLNLQHQDPSYMSSCRTADLAENAGHPWQDKQVGPSTRAS